MKHGRKIEKNRGWYITASFFIVLAIVYLSFNMLDGWKKYRESNKRLEASTISFQELTEQYEELQKKRDLENSITGYEMNIRSKFDLIKPDEKVVFITSEAVPKPVQEDKGIKKVINKFKNFFN